MMKAGWPLNLDLVDNSGIQKGRRRKIHRLTKERVLQAEEGEFLVGCHGEE